MAASTESGHEASAPDVKFNFRDAIRGFTPEEVSAISGRIAAPGVPPKSEKEAKQHLHEIMRLREHERQLMAEEARENRRRREERSKAIEHWLAVAVPHWDTERFSRETRRIWAAQGIAPEVRARVWALAIGNPHHITHHMYELCRTKARDRMERHQRHPPRAPSGGDIAAESDRGSGTRDAATFSPRISKVESAALIDVDLPRTFLLSRPDCGGIAEPQGQRASASPSPLGSPRSASPVLEIDTSSPPQPALHGDAPDDQNSPLTRAANGNPSSLSSSALLISRFSNAEMLARLNMTLRTFVEFRPDMGYVQGMSYLAAMLLMHLEDETAFVCFATLLTRGHFPYFYTVNHSAMSAHMAVFDEVLHLGCPDLHRSFAISGVCPQLYVIDWWMSLFSRTLPFELAARCWDLFLLDDAYLYRISLCILLYFRRFLDDDVPLDEVMKFLSRLQKSYLDERRFFAMVADTDTYGPDIDTIHQVMDKHLAPLQQRAAEAEKGGGAGGVDDL